tara:strand:+ start:1022 stop:1927 length:906 start_codon:yes stop_codon:yes gene_type:complete
MADEALQQEAEQEELTEVELPESEDNEDEELQVEEEPQQEAKKESDEIEDYSEGVKKRIAKLTYKIREAERREQAAIDYAKSVQGELNKTKNKLSKTDQNLYDEYKGRVGSELQAAQDRYKKAYESGDTDAMLEAQKSIAKLAVEEESLNRVRAKQPEEVEEAVVDVDKEIQTRSQVQQEPQVQADPKAQDWAKKNEWFGSDVAMTTSAFAFHRQLVEQEGYDPTSDEYYAEVDKRMAEAFPHKLGKTQQNMVNEVVAGSSRGSTTARTRSRRKVQLTPSQVAIAKRLGVPLEEYAKHIKE